MMWGRFVAWCILPKFRNVLPSGCRPHLSCIALICQVRLLQVRVLTWGEKKRQGKGETHPCFILSSHTANVPLACTRRGTLSAVLTAAWWIGPGRFRAFPDLSIVLVSSSSVCRVSEFTHSVNLLPRHHKTYIISPTGLCKV